MNSILNSISSGDLQVLNVPRVKPVKEDSIINILQNSEIEFKIEPKQTPKLNNFDSQFSTIINNPNTTNQDVTNNSIIELLQNNYEIDSSAFNNCCDCQDKSEIVIEAQHNLLKDCNCKDKQEQVSTQDLQDLLQNSEIEFNCPTFEDKLSNVNSGFGANNDLHYECPCNPPKLKIPLYKENFLKEFETEAEKAEARHSLGLYNKGDVVAMSLLTAENGIPNSQQWLLAEIKQMRKGDKFFTPFTSFAATYDSEGQTLDSRMREIHNLFQNHQKQITQINQISLNKGIESLGDVKLFLEGFDKKEPLQKTLDTMDKQMVRFETIGQL